MKIITAYAMPLSPALLLAAIAETNTVCAMSKAQYVSWQITLFSGLVAKNEDTEPADKILDTVFSIPVVIDESLPPSTIEIRQKGQALVRLENLAIPMSMCA